MSVTLVASFLLGPGEHGYFGYYTQLVLAGTFLYALTPIVVPREHVHLVLLMLLGGPLALLLIVFSASTNTQDPPGALEMMAQVSQKLFMAWGVLFTVAIIPIVKWHYLSLAKKSVTPELNENLR